jgi:hypothetical protein
MLGTWKLNSNKARNSLFQYHDTTHSPVALYQFNGNMLDSSGNGFHLSLFTGLERYTWLAPGLRGFFFDGETSIRRPGNDALLTITGAITIECIILVCPNALTGTFISFGGGAATTITNKLYELDFSSSTRYQFGVRWERLVSSPVSYVTNEEGLPYCFPVHYAMTRSAGSSQTVNFYVNGESFGINSGMLAPTGGTSSRLWVGSDDNPLVTFDFMVCSMASLKIIPSQLSLQQLKMEYNKTVGHFYGNSQ